MILKIMYVYISIKQLNQILLSYLKNILVLQECAIDDK